jgi:hypothetical protein
MAPPAKKKAGGAGFLTQKMGPLPVWGWLAVAVVGIYLYRKISGQSAASTTATTTTTPTSTYGATTPTLDYTSQGVSPPAGTYTYTPTGTQTTGTGTTTPPVTTPTPVTAAAPPPGVPTNPQTPGSGGGVNAGYFGISDPNLAGAYQRGGGTLYYQPGGPSGGFAPVTAQSNLPRGTALFGKS